ncbi:MAG: ribosome small subunit-dependent GTPase A [Burkholderiales bacterium]
MNTQLLSGRIIKGIGGFYYIQDERGCIHECKARGRFRKDGVTPLTGDNVKFSPGGFIEEIEPRKNELKRPRVVNIDTAAIVVSAAKPDVDYLLCDKLLVSIKLERIRPLIIINKCDIAESSRINEIKSEYKDACETVCVSAKSGEGIDALKELLSGGITCFAGQSAVGKSSIINALFPSLGLKTGQLSKKTERGAHTTRQAELLVGEEFSGAVVDTPGFTFFDCADIAPEKLSFFYEDMAPYRDKCRFTSCLHAGEPGCAVKEAAESVHISQGRYTRYLQILKEIQEKRSRKYD